MDRDLAARACAWSWRRQRLDRSSRGVEDCLQSVIGVYSSNPQGPLSLLARVPRLMKGAAVEGVVSTKRAIRIPAMRRSVFLVPTINADQIFSATRLSESSWTAMMRKGGLTQVKYDNLRARILEVATGPMSLEQIRDALPRPPKILGQVLQFMCAQGVLLRIRSSSIRTNDLTYAATNAWLGHDLRHLDEDEALAWLAGRYLTAFGPATVEDFAWWTGHPQARAAAALTSHEPVDLGDGYLLHRRDERAFMGLRPMTGRVTLLPKWDAYTMGYAPAGRARFVDPSLIDRVYDSGGNAGPVVLVEGRVAGIWSLRLTKTRATIQLSMFDRPTAALRDRLLEEANLVGAFLEAPSTRTEIEKVPKRAPAKRPKAVRAATTKPRRTKGTR